MSKRTATKPESATVTLEDLAARQRMLAGLGLVALAFAAMAGQMSIPGIMAQGLGMLGLAPELLKREPWHVARAVADAVAKEFSDA